MKNTTIITGPQGSGKTTISKAIEMSYPEQRVRNIAFSDLPQSFDNCELVVISEIPCDMIRTTCEMLNFYHPGSRVIFETQETVPSDFGDFAHVIKTR